MQQERGVGRSQTLMERTEQLQVFNLIRMLHRKGLNLTKIQCRRMLRHYLYRFIMCIVHPN